ncbi:MAG: 3'-5' exonuclease [Candidatus Levybacteria bacterium]|nr:3'-5' exonuclease [Candidatus Levybacteria bacterium]
MDKLIFLDTETTGIDLLVDRLIQVAYKHKDTITSSYFKPPVPISVKSMSISHITNKMVADKEEFSNSQMKKDLQELFVDNILVAHNAGFDIDMLYKEGVKVPKFIDTLKVVRFLDEDNEIPEYSLQYLRYFLDFDIEATAHEAVGDVLVLEKLFEYLYKRMFQKSQDTNLVLEQMIDISSKPLLLKLFNYGKHKGKKIEEVLSYDKNYLEWMLEQKLNNEYHDEDWIFTLKYHLKIS